MCAFLVPTPSALFGFLVPLGPAGGVVVLLLGGLSEQQLLICGGLQGIHCTFQHKLCNEGTLHVVVVAVNPSGQPHVFMIAVNKGTFHHGAKITDLLLG